MHYIVLMAMEKSPYNIITLNKCAAVFYSIADAKKLAETIAEKNHLLPRSYNYRIFKEIDLADYDEQETQEQGEV